MTDLLFVYIVWRFGLDVMTFHPFYYLLDGSYNAFSCGL